MSGAILSSLDRVVGPIESLDVFSSERSDLSSLAKLASAALSCVKQEGMSDIDFQRSYELDAIETILKAIETEGTTLYDSFSKSLEELDSTFEDFLDFVFKKSNSEAMYSQVNSFFTWSTNYRVFVSEHSKFQSETDLTFPYFFTYEVIRKNFESETKRLEGSFEEEAFVEFLQTCLVEFEQQEKLKHQVKVSRRCQEYYQGLLQDVERRIIIGESRNEKLQLQKMARETKDEHTKALEIKNDELVEFGKILTGSLAESQKWKVQNSLLKRQLAERNPLSVGAKTTEQELQAIKKSDNFSINKAGFLEWFQVVQTQKINRKVMEYFSETKTKSAFRAWQAFTKRDKEVSEVSQDFKVLLTGSMLERLACIKLITGDDVAGKYQSALDQYNLTNAHDLKQYPYSSNGNQAFSNNEELKEFMTISRNDGTGVKSLLKYPSDEAEIEVFVSRLKSLIKGDLDLTS